MTVVWQRWRRADASIFAAFNDLIEKISFDELTIAKCGKKVCKACVKLLGSFSVSIPKLFLPKLPLEWPFCLSLRKSAVASARQLKKLLLSSNFSKESGSNIPNNQECRPWPWSESFPVCLTLPIERMKPIEVSNLLNESNSKLGLKNRYCLACLDSLSNVMFPLLLSNLFKTNRSYSCYYLRLCQSHLQRTSNVANLNKIIMIDSHCPLCSSCLLEATASVNCPKPKSSAACHVGPDRLHPQKLTTNDNKKQEILRQMLGPLCLLATCVFSDETNQIFQNLNPNPNIATLLRHKGRRHLAALTRWRLRLSNDVETHPGPDQRQIFTTTYNVRGLSDERKLRHLLQQMHQKKGGKNLDFFACFQETYIETPGKIPYIWRGNYFLTPGTGHSCGCLTLLSSHINVLASQALGNRGHVLACQKSGEQGVVYIVANIYAPNPNSNEKLEFFSNVFETVAEFQERYNCQNSIVMGDFNLTFKATEMKNRNYTIQEQRVANTVKALIVDLELEDVWDKSVGFTWRRPNTDTFSTIDRILFSNLYVKPNDVRDVWSLSYSDHAAVEASFSFVNRKVKPRTRITRLDPSLAKSEWARDKIERDFNEMFATMPGDWNPHAKLEFAKMCIRTVVEQTQAERKRNEASEEDLINEELDTAVAKLASGSLMGNRTENLIEHVERLRARKDEIINIKGERLAEKLGTKWYNEGEKSTRYFLRLLNRAVPDDFKSVRGQNGEINDPDLIEQEIVNFYKGLYENYDKSEIEILQDDDEFFKELDRIPEAEAGEIIKPLTVSDLTATLLSCSDSAPGPDGIPYSIIRLLWPVFGELLRDAWNYSLQIGKLPPSHKVSYLKLIPKVGKDLNELNNWRPITLSNCDHKLITKTYANRMCLKVAPLIKERQTAYLKGRLINDNIRSMLSTINITNLEERCKGILVSLDARKAFDSVEHGYIERCLSELGCDSFNAVFRLLYSELKTDIIINGRIVSGFNILRGVKQGDSLSCILFIICMEPLLRNLESNASITPIRTEALGELPKAYAYADDVNCTITNSQAAVQAVFTEYERLSKRSGLVLNADKTEVLSLGTADLTSFNVVYMGRHYDIRTKPIIKINGVYFQKDLAALVNDNVRTAMSRMDKFFRNWSKRSLSTLGRILIVKTFGISQIIYLMQSIALTDVHYKAINALLYKFIRNRHYLAAKAPERIKREIMNKSIKLGGYGMLDIAALDSSLKIRALGKLLASSHPFLTKLKDKCDFESFFEPKGPIALETVLGRGIELLKLDRSKLWDRNNMDRNVSLIGAVRSLAIAKTLNHRGRLSLRYFMLRTRGANKISDLTLGDIAELERFIDPNKMNLLRQAIATAVPNNVRVINSCILVKERFKEIVTCTSKEIRESRMDSEPVRNFKLGYNLDTSEALNWGYKLGRVTSVKHKNTLLKVAHGDVYTKEKLHRFNLSDDASCPRCGDIETLQHKFITCEYVERIWRTANSYTNRLITINQSTIDGPKRVTGSFVEATPTILTINAEILLRISYLKSNQNYLIHPKTFVVQCLRTIARNEKKVEIKDELKTLLET